MQKMCVFTWVQAFMCMCPHVYISMCDYTQLKLGHELSLPTVADPSAIILSPGRQKGADARRPQEWQLQHYTQPNGCATDQACGKDQVL